MIYDVLTTWIAGIALATVVALQHRLILKTMKRLDKIEEEKKEETKT